VLPACEGPDRLAWEVATSRGEVVVVGESGAVHRTVPVGSPELITTIRSIGSARVRGIVHPGVVRDELAKELVREDWRGLIVVRDPTRVQIAPVYYRAWTKDGGEFRVVRPASLLAVLANPVSPVGEDADPVEFRDRIAESLVDIPVHDVVLEDPESSSRPGWRLWAR
jgi:hypothetical protein